MKVKKIIFILFVAIITLLLSTGKSEASLYLNNLDFTAQINEDGSMNVVETWNIDISETNTLYKTFTIDKSKYTALTDISVKEITRGTNKAFRETKTWAYHIDKNYFFGGINNDGKYEIAWGVGLDNRSDTRTYLISYTVEDAIKKYGDCTELYWQFVGEDFEISADSITGIIKLPNRVDDKKEIKVWGHTENLNGEIYTTSTNTVEFNLNNYKSGNFVEVRIVMPNYVMEELQYTSYRDKLDDIIEEETEWAEEANRRRKNSIIIGVVVFGIIMLMNLIIGIPMIKKMKKYIRELKQMKKYKPSQKLEYFREIPDESATPAEASFLRLEGVGVNSATIGDIFSATILDLNLKGYIEINVDKTKKDEIIIKNLKKEPENLPENEKVIFRFLKIAMKDKDITMKELQKEISKLSSSIPKMVKNLDKSVGDTQEKKKNYNEEESKKRSEYYGSQVCYLVFGFVAMLIILTIPLGILLLINGVLCSKIAKKCNVLTEKGLDEKEKWQGLMKYMLDFSLLNEKEIPAIVVWEKYLVFATAFGIADKVLKQLKLIYPEIENIDAFSTASCIYIMNNTNFSTSFASSMSSSFSSAMSSGSGSGGGFSGGGGGRRPVEEVGGGR